MCLLKKQPNLLLDESRVEGRVHGLGEDLEVVADRSHRRDPAQLIFIINSRQRGLEELEGLGSDLS